MRDYLFAALFLIAVAFMLPLHNARADTDFDRVADRATFLQAVEGKRLTRLGIKLIVGENGDISGNAFGRKVTGGWTWENGFFCRTIYYGRESLPLNCQMVKLRGDTLRFIADKGTGDTADLRLR